MFDLYTQAMNWCTHASRTEWLVVLTVTMVLGFLCMVRGYGSRSNY